MARMSENFYQHFCEFEIKMTQHFSVFEVKMTLTGLASYLALSVIVLLRYILIYCRILFIINRGMVHYTISMS